MTQIAAKRPNRSHVPDVAHPRQLALRDAFITGGNDTQLADGLGTTLDASYQARAHDLDRERYTRINLYAAARRAAVNTPI